jgi:hypothetical protein
MSRQRLRTRLERERASREYAAAIEAIAAFLTDKIRSESQEDRDFARSEVANATDLDIMPCEVCGLPTVCVPEGLLPTCDDCYRKRGGE